VELAQLNVARPLEPLGSARLAGFVAVLAEVNAVADAAAGFCWRLQTEDGDATALRPWGDDLLVNLSVWSSPAALQDFVYGPAHLAVLRRRRDWFAVLGESHLVLWWVPVGHRPHLDEAGDRLARLRRDGPGPSAFTLRQTFPATGP
jgi:hypothetical protein